MAGAVRRDERAAQHLVAGVDGEHDGAGRDPLGEAAGPQALREHRHPVVVEPADEVDVGVGDLALVHGDHRGRDAAQRGPVGQHPGVALVALRRGGQGVQHGDPQGRHAVNLRRSSLKAV